MSGYNVNVHNSRISLTTFEFAVSMVLQSNSNRSKVIPNPLWLLGSKVSWALLCMDDASLSV